MAEKTIKKEKLMNVLLNRALFDDEKSAGAAIMAGEVYVGGQRAKAGQMVQRDADIIVRGRTPFVSKGGLKLSGALRDFHLSPSGRVCIDAGASTGGFTDCLIQNGASLVYAVDVGFGQLMGALRQNAKVVNLERCNIGDDKLLSLSPTPDLGTVDLSYLSLKKGIPLFAEILRKKGDLICLVKPLFEIDDVASRRTGVIEDDQYAPLLNDLICYVNDLPYATVMDVTNSPVTGNTGTREFFLHVRLEKLAPAALSDRVQTAVEKAKALEEYKK